MIDLYVVRHFKTGWNRRGLCQGRKSGRIIKDSSESLDKIANLFSNIDIAYIISSDLTRAKYTAKRIKKRLNFKQNIKYFKAFRELNFGIFEGVHYRSIAIQQPEIYDKNGYFKYNIRLHGGESMNDLFLRVRRGLTELRGRNGNILLIAHGNIIRALYSIFNEIDYNEVYSKEDIETIKYHKFVIK